MLCKFKKWARKTEWPSDYVILIGNSTYELLDLLNLLPHNRPVHGFRLMLPKSALASSRRCWPRLV
jgi:hypothetical protein